MKIVYLCDRHECEFCDNPECDILMVLIQREA